MNNQKRPFRQVHMDFHTSGAIAHIAAAFDAEDFAQTLQAAHVNSVTCFSRCHHGYLYYDSKAYPQLVHPHLENRNLLKEQIQACHRRGILVPIYTTVQWDQIASTQHPDWVCLNRDGSFKNRCSDEERAPIYEAGFYRTLCVNSPYRDFLKGQVRDVVQSLGADCVDGFFFDIVNPVDCSCRHCREKMQAQGMNPALERDRKTFARQTMKDFKEDMSAFVRSLQPEASIFYNSGHINDVAVDAAEAYTHWELESLPSGEWGYSHFPNTVRFARTTGKEVVAHTGKFHTDWGDFHSFKNREALQYECFRMLAYNAKCLVGDQLEPDGAISQATYQLIGDVYRSVEEKEPWCDEAQALVDLAVFSTECLTQHTGCGGKVPKEVNGVCTMLDELGYQFDIVDARSDFTPYQVLILPDTVRCTETLARKVEQFVAGGGKLIASGQSGLDLEGARFVLPALGLKYQGHAPYDVDYVMPNETMGRQLPPTEHVMYRSGEQVQAVAAEVLAHVCVPYFNRTWEHFCSHKHTPSSHRRAYPAITAHNGCYYFAHPIFSIYQEKHPRWCRELVKDVLQQCVSDPLIRHNGPTSLRVTVNQQLRERRYVLHLLHYIPVKESEEVYTIEDVIPLSHVHLSVHVPRGVRRVRLVPEGKEIDFCVEDGRVSFEVPQLNGHQMVELMWADQEG